MITVRTLQAHENKLLKHIRLAALADSPRAYSSNLTTERALPDRYWIELAAGAGQFINSATFVAEHGGSAVAMAGCFPETKDRYRLVAMWVAPPFRRAGIARTLIGAICTQVLDRGGRELVAGVFESNLAAITCYRNLGFAQSSVDEALDHGSQECELQLVKDLTATVA